MGWEDDRGVSEVLGAILLFGIIVLAIGGYQSFVVPQQNAETEFEHETQVNDEFLTIQEAISNAAASGKQRTTSIKLGTEYPIRSLTTAWPAVTGNLKTTEASAMESDDGGDELLNLEYACGLDGEDTDELLTRSVVYKANYNERSNAGTLVYENGVTYREHETSHERIIQRSDQELIDKNTIHLYPITNGDFDRTASAREQLRVYPGETGAVRVSVDGDQGESVELKLPTRLSKSQWEGILEDEDLEGAGIEIDRVEDGTLYLTLTDGSYTMNCTPIGLDNTPAQVDLIPRTDDPRDNDEREINPRGTVYLDSASIEDDTATISLKNEDEFNDWTITKARIPFVLANGDPTSATINEDGDSLGEVDIGDPYKLVDDQTIEAKDGGTHGGLELQLEFDDTLTSPAQAGGGPQFDPLVILSLRLESGGEIRYQTFFITDNVVEQPEGEGED